MAYFYITSKVGNGEIKTRVTLDAMAVGIFMLGRRTSEYIIVKSEDGEMDRIVNLGDVTSVNDVQAVCEKA